MSSVQQLLDMRAGTRFREDYDDPEAEAALSAPMRWATVAAVTAIASALSRG